MLLKNTWDSDWVIRIRAVKALASVVTTPEVWQRLLQLTWDEDWCVRRAAVEALEPVVSEVPVGERLFKLLSDEDWYLQTGAMRTLATASTLPAVWDQIASLTDASPPPCAMGCKRTTYQKPRLQITFHQDLSAEQVRLTLTALADYYRACGGLGFGER